MLPQISGANAVVRMVAVRLGMAGAFVYGVFDSRMGFFGNTNFNRFVDFGCYGFGLQSFGQRAAVSDLLVIKPLESFLGLDNSDKPSNLILQNMLHCDSRQTHSVAV